MNTQFFKIAVFKLTVCVALSATLSPLVQAMQEQQQEEQKPSVFTSPTARNQFYSEAFADSLLADNFEKAQEILTRWSKTLGFDANFIPQKKGERNQHSLLHIVAMYGNPALVRRLIQAGANPNIRDIKDRTPLHMAAEFNKDPEVITILINAGADINAKARTYKTPLHYALDTYNIPVIQTLLKNPKLDPEIIREISMLHPLSNNPEVKRMLAPYLMSVKETTLDYIVKNIDAYRDKLHLLPVELQKEIQERLLYIDLLKQQSAII